MASWQTASLPVTFLLSPCPFLFPPILNKHNLSPILPPGTYVWQSHFSVLCVIRVLPLWSLHAAPTASCAVAFMLKNVIGFQDLLVYIIYLNLGKVYMVGMQRALGNASGMSITHVAWLSLK